MLISLSLSFLVLLIVPFPCIVFEDALRKLPARDLSMISTTFGLKSMIAGKISSEKTRVDENCVLLLQGMILNLEQELSSSKKLSQELEVHTIL